jgi:hypothetical protein
MTPETCILTGADGENPDDCTTHEHEEPRIEACAWCGEIGPWPNYAIMVEAEGTLDWRRAWIFLCPKHEAPPTPPIPQNHTTATRSASDIGTYAQAKP